MTIKSDVKLDDAFSGKTAKAEDRAAAVPERIRRHAPVPALRPDGGWKARANEVDRRVREQQEAQKARNEWAARRQQVQPDRTLKTKFGRSVT